MRINNRQQYNHSFKWLLKKEEVAILKQLPKEKLAEVNNRLANAPIGNTKEASNIRDNIIKEAIELSRRINNEQ